METPPVEVGSWVRSRREPRYHWVVDETTPCNTDLGGITETTTYRVIRLMLSDTVCERCYLAFSLQHSPIGELLWKVLRKPRFRATDDEVKLAAYVVEHGSKLATHLREATARVDGLLAHIDKR